MTQGLLHACIVFFWHVYIKVSRNLTDWLTNWLTLESLIDKLMQAEPTFEVFFLVLVLTGASGWLRLWLWRHENNSGSWHLGREQPREGGPRQAEGIRIQTGIEGRSACTKQASGLKRDVPEEMYESNRLQTRSMSQIQALTWHVMTLSIGEGHNLYLSP